MYKPHEIMLRYPKEPDGNARWKDVWDNAFNNIITDFLLPFPQSQCSLELGIRTMRLAELCHISLIQNSKKIDNITMTNR